MELIGSVMVLGSDNLPFETYWLLDMVPSPCGLFRSRFAFLPVPSSLGLPFGIRRVLVLIEALRLHPCGRIAETILSRIPPRRQCIPWTVPLFLDPALGFLPLFEAFSPSQAFGSFCAPSGGGALHEPISHSGFFRLFVGLPPFLRLLDQTSDCQLRLTEFFVFPRLL